MLFIINIIYHVIKFRKFIFQFLIFLHNRNSITRISILVKITKPIIKIELVIKNTARGARNKYPAPIIINCMKEDTVFNFDIFEPYQSNEEKKKHIANINTKNNKMSNKNNFQSLSPCFL